MDKAQALKLYVLGNRNHDCCPPFGSGDQYALCVELFEKALEALGDCQDETLRYQISWALEDARADQAYYMFRDYRRAAKHYAASARVAKRAAGLEEAPQVFLAWKRRQHYARAVLNESLSFVHREGGRLFDAWASSLKAMNLYSLTVQYARAGTDHRNRHTVSGLGGELVTRLAADLEQTSPELAMILLEKALELFDNRLAGNPLWENAPTHENPAAWSARIHRRLARLKGDPLVL